MIQLSRNYSLPERDDQIIAIKVIAVGSAGSNALDRVVLDGMDKSDLIAANTDVQSLASSVAAVKVQLGRSLTRGLGTGGDPELGFDAAQESADEIRQALAEARLIFICTGLGGGTGSGASPVIAQIAREMGALVIGFATLPFTFEGKRRTAQARDALARLHETTDAVVCFENDRMADMVAPKAGIHQAFAVADMTISQSLRSIVNLIQRPGIMRIGFDDLLAALRSRNGRCLFGFGESDSDNRAHDALAQALKNPLMDRGRMLADAARVLVQVAGGPGMTLSEVEILMQELGRHVNEQTQILFVTAVDGRMGNRLSVTIISSLAADEDSIPEQVYRDQSSMPAMPPVWGQSQGGSLKTHIESEPTSVEGSQSAEAIPIDESAPVDTAPPLTAPVLNKPEPRLITPQPKPARMKEEKPSEKNVQAKQEVLQFEPVTRGRFEKSEPTIVEGEDLDVPTYLRKNIKVK